MITLTVDPSALQTHQLDAFIGFVKSLREPHYIKTSEEQTAVHVTIGAPPERVAPSTAQYVPEWE
jgi:hypothetical protein